MTHTYFNRKHSEMRHSQLKSPMKRGDNLEFAEIIERSQFANEQKIIFGTTGSGKSVFLHSSIQIAKNIGKYTIIQVTAKNGNEYDLAFANFIAHEEHQKALLENFGRKPKAEPVKLYNPFVMDREIKTKERPETIFYTHSIKDVTENAWAILLNAKRGSSAVKICLDTATALRDDEGLHELIFKIQDKLDKEDESYSLGSKDDFYALDKAEGNKNTLLKILKRISKLKKYNFIQPQSCPYNLDYRAMMDDQEHYHIFLRDNIDKRVDKDIYYFELVCFLEKLLSEMDKYKGMKNPLALIFEEIRILLNKENKTYSQTILAEVLKEILSQIRDKGKGASTIATSQVITGTDKDYFDSCDEIYFGKMPPNDFKTLAKDYGSVFKTHIMETIQKLNTGDFINWKKPNSVITVAPPQHAMKYEGDSFLEKLREFHPEKLKKHAEVYDYFEAQMKDKDAISKEKAEKLLEKKKLEAEAKKKAKEKKEQAPKAEKEKQTEEQQKQKEFVYQKACDYLQTCENKGERFSWRELQRKLAEDFNVKIGSHKTVIKWVIDTAKEKQNNAFESLSK